MVYPLIEQLQLVILHIPGMQQSSRNEPLLKAQEKYYRAESELLQEANKSYWALRTYTEEADKAGFVHFPAPPPVPLPCPLSHGIPEQAGA